MESYKRAQSLLELQLLAHPENLEGRSSLAVIFNNIGLIALHGGRPEQALPLFQRNLAMHQELVRADPTNSWYHAMLAIAHSNVGEAQFRSARFDEAFRSFREGIATDEALASAYPSHAGFRADSARLHAKLGAVHAANGVTSEAQAEIGEAERILDQMPVAPTTALLALAGGYAMLSKLVVSDQRRTNADRAMATLRRAQAEGWHDLAALDSDPRFDALRSRPDFQDLRMDLSFPGDPFAR
jgi:serine/threonine-protein kinase